MSQMTERKDREKRLKRPTEKNNRNDREKIPIERTDYHLIYPTLWHILLHTTGLLSYFTQGCRSSLPEGEQTLQYD